MQTVEKNKQASHTFLQGKPYIMRVCAYISNGINAGSAKCVCMQIIETAKHLRRKLRRINNVYMSVSVVHKSRSVGVEGVELLGHMVPVPL